MSTYTRTALQYMSNRELTMLLIYPTTRGGIITNPQLVRHWILEEMRSRGFELSDDDIEYLTK